MQPMLTSAIVSFLVSLTVLASYLFAKDSSDLNINGDWLGFLGAVVGAGLAVIGAVHVERTKQDGVKAESLNMLANALETLGKLLSEMHEASSHLIEKSDLFKVKGDEREQLFMQHSYALKHIGEQAFQAIADQVDFIAYYADKQPIGSSTLWSELRRVERAHGYWRKRLVEPDRVRHLSFDEAYDERAKIAEMCRAMGTPIDSALQELNGQLMRDRGQTIFSWKQLEPSLAKRDRLLATLPKQMIYRTPAIRIRRS